MSMRVHPRSLFALAMQTIAVVFVTMLITGVGAVPPIGIDKRFEIEKASNATSNSTFACVNSNIKPVTSLINEVLNATGYVPVYLIVNVHPTKAICTASKTIETKFHENPADTRRAYTSC